MKRAVIVLLLIGTLAVASVAQTAELTLWQLAPDSLPGELHWVDGELFVALHNPRGIGALDPTTGTLRVWSLSQSPGEFEVIGSRALFAVPNGSQMGWLNLDYGMLSTFAMPQPMSRPIQVLKGGSPLDTELWYLDWEHGVVGRFSPFESGPFSVRDIVPSLYLPAPRLIAIEPIQDVALGEFYPYSPMLVPPVSVTLPATSDPFTEWLLFSSDAPAFGFARSTDGRIWLSGNDGAPLQALSPWDNTITTYDLPGNSRVSTLTGGEANEVAYLAYAADGAVTLGIVDGASGDVSLWTIPGASDPVGLRAVDGVLWFCDRGISAVGRFDPVSSTVTWWLTGGDDGPLYLEPGADGDMWVSLERSGAIARLRPR